MREGTNIKTYKNRTLLKISKIRIKLCNVDFSIFNVRGVVFNSLLLGPLYARQGNALTGDAPRE